MVLDGVFNHVGRGFWAFQDVKEKREASPYKDWFHINFGGNSGYNDGFWYEGWEGHYELVKLNLQNPEMCIRDRASSHFCGAPAASWSRAGCTGFWAPPAAGKPRCSLCWAAWTAPRAGTSCSRGRTLRRQAWGSTGAPCGLCLSILQLD